MEKRKLHHLWTRLRPISHWYFLVLCLVFGGVGILAMRSNNITAIRLKDEVIKADQQNGDTEAALRRLREHIYSHMNTNLASGSSAIRPPIQLRHRYERLVAAEKERVEAINSRIYIEAQTVCEQQIPTGLSGSGRVLCNQQYVTEHGVKEQPIPDGLYKFDFVSPTWSPDLAGWSLVASIAFGLLFLLRWSAERWIKHELR